MYASVCNRRIQYSSQFSPDSRKYTERSWHHQCQMAPCTTDTGQNTNTDVHQQSLQYSRKLSSSYSRILTISDSTSLPKYTSIVHNDSFCYQLWMDKKRVKMEINLKTRQNHWHNIHGQTMSKNIFIYSYNKFFSAVLTREKKYTLTNWRQIGLTKIKWQRTKTILWFKPTWKIVTKTSVQTWPNKQFFVASSAQSN